MMKHLLSRYGGVVDQFNELWDVSHRPLPTCIWTNGIKTSDYQLQQELSRHHISLEPLEWTNGAFRSYTWPKPGSTLAFLLGWYLVQEEIAMTAVDALSVNSGDIILDLCAAPGNKTVQIAKQLDNRGILIANERNMGRLSSLWNTIARMGMMNIMTTHYDGRMIPFPNGMFDRVLVDVPCSGEGTLRKHLDRDWSISQTMKAIAQLVPIQKKLLSRALDLVKPGGIVVYSTCTFAPEENEAVLDAVMGDCAVVEPFHISGLLHAPGLTHWQGKAYRSDLSHAHRYYPHQNDTGGFFVARLRRTNTARAEMDVKDQSSLKARQSECINAQGELNLFCDRFGIAPEIVQSMRLWKKGRGKYWLAHVDCNPLFEFVLPVGVQNLGLPLFRTVKGILKPTTAALQRFGKEIKWNSVELNTPEQMQQFLLGRSQRLSIDSFNISDRNYNDQSGYVHVRLNQYQLGCGYWHQGVLHSQIPKALRINFQSIDSDRA